MKIYLSTGKLGFPHFPNSWAKNFYITIGYYMVRV